MGDRLHQLGLEGGGGSLRRGLASALAVAWCTTLLLAAGGVALAGPESGYWRVSLAVSAATVGPTVALGLLELARRGRVGAWRDRLGAAAAAYALAWCLGTTLHWLLGGVVGLPWRGSVQLLVLALTFGGWIAALPAVWLACQKDLSDDGSFAAAALGGAVLHYAGAFLFFG